MLLVHTAISPHTATVMTTCDQNRCRPNCPVVGLRGAQGMAKTWGYRCYCGNNLVFVYLPSPASGHVQLEQPREVSEMNLFATFIGNLR